MKFLASSFCVLLSIAALGQNWTPNGTNTYFSTGKVAIGIASNSISASRLYVQQDANSSSVNAMTILSNNPQGHWPFVMSTNGFSNPSGFYSSSASDFSMLLRDHNGTATVQVYSYGNSFFNGGLVGIGTSSPIATLDVSGTRGTTDARNFRVLYSNTGQLSGTELSGLSHLIANEVGSSWTTAAWTALYAKAGTSSSNYAAVFNGKSYFKGEMVLDGGSNNPKIFTSNDGSGKYMSLHNSPNDLSAAGIKAGGLLISDNYAYANPDKNDLIVKGNVGIGLATPASKLEVNGTISMVRGNKLQFLETAGGAPRAFIGSDATNHLKFHIGSGAGTDAMIIDPSGKVGIGIMNPDQALTVNGIVHTKEVRVDVESPLSVGDYVFESDYKLMPLNEIESYVKENKHLPEVPSAQEFVENGMDLKAMNLLLLKKIEELTLLLIDQNKSIEQLKEKIEVLEKEK